MRYKSSRCEHSLYERTRRGGGGHGEELIYHRDTEDTEFRIRKEKDGWRSGGRRLYCYSIRIFFRNSVFSVSLW